MFKKIVWATDGSDAADQTLGLAKTLAAEGAAEVLVVHCVEITLPGKAGGALPIHADEDELRAKIERQVAELNEAGTSARLEAMKTRIGGAAHAIAEAAENWPADLIVVGTRGHTQLGGLLVGSVTQRLLHISPCPVLAAVARGANAGG